MKYQISVFSRPYISLPLAILFLMFISSCSTTGASKNDPLEPMNRAIFGFNEVVDNSVLKPVAKTYKYITDFPDYKTSSKYKRILLTEFNENDKIKFIRKIGKQKNKTFYLDKKLKNPFPGLEDFNLAWTDVSRKNKPKGFEIPITAGTGRLIIRPDRKDSENNDWKGLLEKDLSSSS